MSGKLLDSRYRLLRRVGTGGMGAVYLGEHLVLKKSVAVKVLRPEFSENLLMARRFELEAIAASRIGHENIVQVTDFGRTPQNELYLVMEYLDGETLDKLARRSPLSPARAAGILFQVCRALAAAHAHGIVHRDLKPHNVMVLQREGRDLAKVLDFGISKVLAPRTEALTERGEVLGTPEYMSPEQVAGRDVDQRADIYSLGIVAYELLTGTHPFSASSAAAYMVAQLERDPEPLRAKRPDLPREVESLVLRCLEKLPERRPSLDKVQAVFSRMKTRAPAPALRSALVWAAAAALALVFLMAGWIGWSARSLGAGGPVPTATTAKSTAAIQTANLGTRPAGNPADRVVERTSSPPPEPAAKSGEISRPATRPTASAASTAPRRKVDDLKPNPFAHEHAR